MSKLEAAMLEHMAYLVFLENRPFSYCDFMHFEVDGKEYNMTHGTYRNKISKLKKGGHIELDYKSGIAFHTLKGHKFGKSLMMMMTPDHTVVSSSYNNQDPVCRLIQNLPVDKTALHNIRLKFESKGIWSVLSSSSSDLGLPVHSISKDICIPTWKIKDLLIRVTVHRTDTVSVIVACSCTPVAVDINGIIRLSNALTRVEERLSRLIEESSRLGNIDPTAVGSDCGNHQNLLIPEHTGWHVTMWHFGMDALIEYTGEKFSCTWESGENALVRVYAKDMKDNINTKIRLERQEYPRKTFAEAIEEKLGKRSYCL